MEDEFVGEARHRPTVDASNLNKAVERASDPSFVQKTIQSLRGLNFPAFKHNILEFARRERVGDESFALLQTLDGYIQYRNIEQVQKSLEQYSSKKMENQISDETRISPPIRTRDIDATAGIKDREAINKNEERDDYPEVTPTAMSDFVCDRCGKAFQNQQDLVHHKQFETGSTATS